MPPLVDLSGKRFGKLIVKDRNLDGKSSPSRWNCICDCGNKCIVFGSNLTRRNTQCKECGYKSKVTHGMSRKSYLYPIWCAIKQRCRNPNVRLYHCYGGRGIKICDEWFNDFSKFAEHVGERPSPKHSIERKDNNGNYEPGNMKWATRVEQNSNKTNNAFVNFNGEKITITELARRTGIKDRTLHGRIRTKRWSVEKAISTPISKSSMVRNGNSDD